MGVDNRSTWTAFVVSFTMRGHFNTTTAIHESQVVNDCLAMRRLRTKIRRGDVLSVGEALAEIDATLKPYGASYDIDGGEIVYGDGTRLLVPVE